MCSNQDNRYERKVICDEMLSELKKLRNLEKKQMDMICSLFPEQNIKERYINIQNEEYPMIEVIVMETETVIYLPQMKHRNHPYLTRIPYEDYLKSELSESVKKHLRKPFNRSMVVFEHMVPASINRGLRDNDNYDTEETKQIIDIMVTSELIQTDRGIQCTIMHLSSITDQKPYTVVHVLDMENTKATDTLMKIIENSNRMNNFHITQKHNANI